MLGSRVDLNLSKLNFCGFGIDIGISSIFSGDTGMIVDFLFVVIVMSFELVFDVAPSLTWKFLKQRVANRSDIYVLNDDLRDLVVDVLSARKAPCRAAPSVLPMQILTSLHPSEHGGGFALKAIWFVWFDLIRTFETTFRYLFCIFRHRLTPLISDETDAPPASVTFRVRVENHPTTTWRWRRHCCPRPIVEIDSGVRRVDELNE
jgi:hypothetical protein